MGNKSYEEIFRLRASDYDRYNRVNMSTILDLCQDIAGVHAEELHVSYEEMLAEDKIWMVLRTKIEVLKYPPLFANVLVRTWPLKPNRVDMDRDYLIMSKDGKETYFKVVSKWVACTYSTRRLVRARDIHFDVDAYEETSLFEGPFNKLDLPEEHEYQSNIVTSTFLDLDHNGHINNVKYFNYIIISIEELQDKVIKNMQIDYIHELSKDTPIEIRYFKENNIFDVKGISNDIESFVAKIEVE